MRRTVLAAVTGLLLLAGCGSTATGTFSEVADADYAKTFPYATSYQLGDERQLTGARLISPHYTVEFTSVIVTRNVNRLAASMLRLGSMATTAAPGHEFLFARVTDDQNRLRPQWTSQIGLPETNNVSASIVVGSRSTPLPRLPEVSSLLAVSTPIGEPVYLEVLDEGKTQRINLRDGKREPGTADAFYRARTGQTLNTTSKTTGPVRFRTDARTLTVTTKIQQANLTPWAPTVGWAKSGRAWLYLSGVDFDCDAYTFSAARRQFPMTVKLDRAKSFTLVSGGSSIRAVSMPLIDISLNYSISKYGVAFDVPSSFVSGTIQYVPDGPMIALYRDAKPAVRWAARPPAAQIPISIPA